MTGDRFGIADEISEAARAYYTVDMIAPTDDLVVKGEGVMHSLRRIILAAALLAVTTAAPAWAQVDFSGEWAPRLWEDQPERAAGPMLGDYLGIPITDAARMRADTWEASVQTLAEWQCRPHSADYIWRGPSQLRISKEVDPASRETTAFHAEWMRSVDRVIYMDDRPHPPEGALHTWAGFSTGKWDGDVLTVTTTHLKEGYLRRNGLPRSDKATLVEHWIRNGDILTAVVVMHDPVYLTEPFIRSSEYELNVHQQVPAYPCGVVQEVDRARGLIPHHLPGANPYLMEFAQEFGIPFDATRGGRDTMYPEFRDRLKTMARPAPKPAAKPAAAPATPAARPATAAPPRPSQSQNPRVGGNRVR